MTSNNGIVLYHYSFSPYGRRVTWYLALRGINYEQCMQPPVMPRPDISALGVAYRRIPVMAIGRDVYCDTRLILRELEKRYPEGALGATGTDHQAVEKLLEAWTIETLFMRASQLLPTKLPLLQDPKFQEDRKDFSGASWDTKAREAARPEALVHIREAFAFLESTLLADGRDWILKTEKPSLADIEGIWPFHWLAGLKGALPRDMISQDQFPKVFQWIQRFDNACKAAREAVPKPNRLTGDVAAERILGAEVSQSISVQENDPSGLTQGQLVEVWPVDTGFKHKDRGILIGLNTKEIVLEVKSKAKDRSIHLHVPRLNYRLRKVDPVDVETFAKL